MNCSHCCYIGLALFFILAPAAIPRADAQEPTCAAVSEVLRSLIQQNSCSQNSDCAIVQLPPPFGCNNFVNRAVVDAIEDTLPLYERECGPYAYQCLRAANKVSCENGRCKGRFSIRHDYPDNAPRNRHGRPLRSR